MGLAAADSHLSKDLSGNVKVPWLTRSTWFRGYLCTWSPFNMMKSYLQTRREVSVITTTRSFSLFQWSTLDRARKKKKKKIRTGRDL